MERAALRARLSVRLGDFKATSQARDYTGSKHYPDFAGMTRDGDPKQGLRFVGECKADWQNKLLTGYNTLTLPPQRRPPNDVSIRPWISKPLSNPQLCLLK